MLSSAALKMFWAIWECDRHSRSCQSLQNYSISFHISDAAHAFAGYDMLHDLRALLPVVLYSSSFLPWFTSGETVFEPKGLEPE
jgi:hypothetical protein